MSFEHTRACVLQVDSGTLVAAITVTASPLFELLSSGLALSRPAGVGMGFASPVASPTSGVLRPGPACVVLKQFFRLLRVAVENRKAGDIVAAVSDLCVGAHMKALVLDPVLCEELAPAYFGVIYQVCSTCAVVVPLAGADP